MTLTFRALGLYFDGYVISHIYCICELFNRYIVERSLFNAKNCVCGDSVSSYLCEYKALPSLLREFQYILSTVYDPPIHDGKAGRKDE